MPVKSFSSLPGQHRQSAFDHGDYSVLLAMKTAATTPARQRKVTYRLYPTELQIQALQALLRSHQQLYNAALEERISAWQKSRKSISYVDQCKSLTEIRESMPEWRAANCSSQQMTLRRLDKAFAAFFRRVKTGENPGFPRFKSLSRFPGISFKSHGDGWSFKPGKDWNHGTLRLSGVGLIVCRGKARESGVIAASDLCLRQGKWSLSLTVVPEAVVRSRVGHAAAAFDWGLENLLSGIDDQGRTLIFTNPRLYRANKKKLKALQEALSYKRYGSARWAKALKHISDTLAKMGRIRSNFLHQLTCRIARDYALVAMEELNAKMMTVSTKGAIGVAPFQAIQKSGLNREILDTAPARLMQLLSYKVTDTGGVWLIAPTRILKPSQTCPQCGNVKKKTLSERLHHCNACGYLAPRDIASAQVVLNWAIRKHTASANPSGTGGGM